MPRGKEISKENTAAGVIQYTLSSWRHFAKLISRDLGEYTGYTWRGHADPNWGLESSFDRMMIKIGRKPNKNTANRLLDRFKKASRGRRGPNPKEIVDVNEWWSLGQHYGLPTPLLDWTASPYVALYYAMKPESKARSRMVYGLHMDSIDNIRKEHAKGIENNLDPNPEWYSPETDENPRLVNQAGHFLRMPVGVEMEDWVKKHFEDSNQGILLKVKVPSKDREACLASLNRMNINQLTLFPDLHGSATHAIDEISLKRYAMAD
ncbi:MAG: FRG domain-containing protein [Planctomycetota bacterium]|nr:FRG domain-containing protein [Planctomycetota bacterium]